MNSQAGDAPKTSNDILAGRIVQALKNAGLLSEKDISTVEQKLCSGKIKEADWRLWAEEVILAKERTGGDKRTN